MNSHLLTNCRIVNEDIVRDGDIRIKNGRIDVIAASLSPRDNEAVTDAEGRWLLPGLIDDQVHFREPGATHKADIASESRAAAAGGVTSYMEMPNVSPPTTTMARLHDKRAVAAADSLTNYAFYLGASTDNLDDIAAADPRLTAGIKIFMGASTGSLLVDDKPLLEKIFAAAPTLVATHCENNARIKDRLATARARYGDDIPPREHAVIRDATACYESSALAIALAKKNNARLHVLHITTAAEIGLFDNAIPLKQKKVTAEACVHHLLFDESDYETLGMRLKCNPAVKTRGDRDAVRAAVSDGRIDVLATDHAPHLPAEKDRPYAAAAAGLPLVEYAMPGFFELVADGVWQPTTVARAGAHNVADLFAVRDRGYIREGYFADLVLLEGTPQGAPARPQVLSKCGWTPFRNHRFRHRVWKTYVNGYCVFADDAVCDEKRGMALEFNR